jgi:hypothetical protein
LEESVVTHTFVGVGEPVRNPVIEKCKSFAGKGPCGKIIQEDKCKVFAFPESKWRFGSCPMATHIVKEVIKEKQRVGQQKQIKVKHKK